jgi:hypothetical protein
MESKLYLTWVQVLWHKVALDIVYMPLYSGKDRLVLARKKGLG